MLSRRGVGCVRFAVRAMVFAAAVNGLAAGAESEGVAIRLGREIADAVEKVMPAVVVVRTEAIEYQLAQDLFYGRLYRIPQRQAGLGSGVVISADGHVLTCGHVVRNARQIEVVMHDGAIHPATVVGVDEASDLAVLKIKADKRRFTPIEPGDSDAIRVGEFVVAIGSPFSLASSVSLGIVSQKGRSLGLLPYEDFIQTDAPINPGNSGGPLVDLRGRMVGINGAIATSGPYSPGNVGIGFAVPSNLAMDIARAIIEKGRFDRPRVGIILGELDPETASRLTGRATAVVVHAVIKGSPADRAGMKPNDIILLVDGAEVGEIRDVQRAVMRHKAGQAVKFQILRDGRKQDLTMKAETEPAPR